MTTNVSVAARSGLLVLWALSGTSLPAIAGPISVPNPTIANAVDEAPDSLQPRNSVLVHPEGGGFDGMVQLVGHGGWRIHGGHGWGGHGGWHMHGGHGWGGHGWRGRGWHSGWRGGHGWRGCWNCGHWHGGHGWHNGWYGNDFAWGFGLGLAAGVAVPIYPYYYYPYYGYDPYYEYY